MKFWQYLAIAAFLFVCMYDPKSRGLEKYVGPQVGSAGVRSTERSCQPQHFQHVQFAEVEPETCPKATPQVNKGAIISR